MNYLFINGSPNKKGNTVKLAKIILGKNEYETVDLVDYKIYSYGQKFEDDQFTEVLLKMKSADIIVIGSPVYWHNMSGAIRNLIDRFYGAVDQGELQDKRLFVVYQGAAPEQWMIDAAEYTMKRFAKMYGMKYIGMASQKKEAKKLSNILK